MENLRQNKQKQWGHMTKILILGAYGQIAQVATRLFLERTDAQLTLYLRKAKRLKSIGHKNRVRVIEGDVLDAKMLEEAIAGQNVCLRQRVRPDGRSNPPYCHGYEQGWR